MQTKLKLLAVGDSTRYSCSVKCTALSAVHEVQDCVVVLMRAQPGQKQKLVDAHNCMTDREPYAGI